MPSTQRLLSEAKRRIEKERKACLASLAEPFYPIPREQKQKTRPAYYRLGMLKEPNTPFHIPSTGVRGFAFCLDRVDRQTANAALEMVALDYLARMAPGYCEVHAMDPERLGMSFPHLTRAGIPSLCQPDEIRAEIHALYSRTTAIVSECLSSYQSLDEFNTSSGRLEPYRIVVLGDLPSGLGADDLNRIRTMLNVAEETGTLFLLTFSKAALEKGTNRQAVQEIVDQLRVVDGVSMGNGVAPMHLQDEPALLSRLFFESPSSQSPALDSLVEDILDTSRKALSFNILDGIRIPFGTSKGAPFYFTLGLETDSFHCIIGGQSGKGKTNLLHNLLARGMCQYGRDELKYVILNCTGTGQTEFQASSHVLRFACTSDIEECVAVVQFVEAIQIEREAMFKEVGAKSLKDYIQKTGEKIPRIIFLIDEFHVLFPERARTTPYVTEVLVGKVLKQGRKFGIHLIAATQSLDGGVHASLLRNIPLRIALGMTPNQSMAFLSERNVAAAGLQRGEAIYNSSNGALQANQFVHIDFLSDEDLARLIEQAESI